MSTRYQLNSSPTYQNKPMYQSKPITPSNSIQQASIYPNQKTKSIQIQKIQKNYRPKGAQNINLQYRNQPNFYPMKYNSTQKDRITKFKQNQIKDSRLNQQRYPNSYQIQQRIPSYQYRFPQQQTYKNYYQKGPYRNQLNYQRKQFIPYQNVREPVLSPKFKYQPYQFNYQNKYSQKNMNPIMVNGTNKLGINIHNQINKNQMRIPMNKPFESNDFVSGKHVLKYKKYQARKRIQPQQFQRYNPNKYKDYYRRY